MVYDGRQLVGLRAIQLTIDRGVPLHRLQAKAFQRQVTWVDITDHPTPWTVLSMLQAVTTYENTRES
ncbi:MAG: hypothetical protein CML19_18325 [Pusillimonas sp.]|nr:hypothetical protein [Pusillimonas sp.]